MSCKWMTTIEWMWEGPWSWMNDWNMNDYVEVFKHEWMKNHPIWTEEFKHEMESMNMDREIYVEILNLEWMKNEYEWLNECNVCIWHRNSLEMSEDSETRQWNMNDHIRDKPERGVNGALQGGQKHGLNLVMRTKVMIFHLILIKW